MPGLFVTATGTDVGKTFVTAGLLRAGLRAGCRMEAVKPVLSGYAEGDAAESDAGVLLAALGRAAAPDAIAAMAPWRFAAPLSPDMAAALEGRRIPFDDVVAFCRAAADAEALALIEGVGGVMVPLDDTRTILDLMAVLDLPSLLVSTTALGAISHCLTAVAAMAGRGLAPAAVILNESAASTVPLAMTLATIAKFCPATPVLILRRDAAEDAFDALFRAVVPLVHRQVRPTPSRAERKAP